MTVYLDHAATTPMLPAAVEAMTAHLLDVGNPSSLHASGRRARRVVEESRETIAQALNCRPGEVVFTSGGTEADNLAVKGIYWARRQADPRRTRIISSSVEHHAVLDALLWLAEREGAQVELLPVDFAASGADALTLTGHKVGGPYGVGALLVRREVDVTALVHGGGQERDIRSGTIDVPAIAGLAAAVELSVKNQADHAARVQVLRDDLVAGVRRAVPDAALNGDPVRRLPGNAHFSFPGCEGDSLLMLLDARGIECSTGSACSAGVPQASHVLLAMGRADEEARSSLRFSLGRTSTDADVRAVVEAIAPCVERARAAKA
jgi:cysteine desulfurase